MNTILYTQNESGTINNTLVVDGERFEDMSSGIASEAFKFINKKSGEDGDFVWLIGQLKKYGKIPSKNFKYKKDQLGIFIKGCFQEKDELGRNMPFLFYIKTTNMNEACLKLKEYASSLNRTCFESEISILENISKYVVMGISISIILLIILIWKI